MDKNFLFSIIIPTYNRKNLLKETLATVLEQRYENFEAIVVDNCSTDGTMQMMAEYEADKRIVYIRHDKNYERATSRNTGIKSAKGDFVTFLDSDDFMYENCLLDANEFANNNPTIKVFQNRYEMVDDHKKKIYHNRLPNLRNQYKAIASGNFIGCIGIFLEKSIIKNIKFSEDSKMIGAEDYEIWFRVLASNQLGRIEKVNCGIREHPQRSVHNGVYSNLEYQKNKLIETLRSDPLLDKIYKPYYGKVLSSFNLMQALTAKALKNKKAAIHHLKNALAVDKSMPLNRRFWAVLYNILI